MIHLFIRERLLAAAKIRRFRSTADRGRKTAIGRGRVKTLREEDFGGPLTLGEVEKIDPSPI